MNFRHIAIVTAALVCTAAPVRADLDKTVLKLGESKLKPAFEGTQVRVKLDMPATSDGIDVNVGAAQPLDLGAYANRLKEHGVSLKSGESAMVTKVKVNARFIEFQLAGGGYGTLWDDTSPDVGIPSAEKTQREKDLEQWIKAETDPDKKGEMQRDLDDLRKDRQREDAANRAVAASATEARRAQIAEKRRSAGSRFNVRWANGVPESAMTPAGLREALKRWVDFGASESSADGAAAVTPSGGGIGALRNGMSIEEVERVLGRPEKLDTVPLGDMKKTTCTYASGKGTIEAVFVEEVLVRYSFRSH